MRLTTALAALAVVALAAVGVVSGQTTTSQNVTANENDARALNYMLAIANVQSALYSVALRNATAQTFVNAGYNETVFNNLTMIMQEHTLQANWMMAELQQLNTTAVMPCTYNFSSILAITVENITTINPVTNATVVNVTITVELVPVNFIKAALLIQNLTLEAYVGVINTVSDPYILQTIASIIAVDGRQAAYLSSLLGVDMFPLAFEPSMPPANVTSTPLPFTEDCPFETLPLPIPRANIVGGACSNSSAPNAPTSQPTTSTSPTTTGPTTAPQSGAGAVTASSALVVTLLAALVGVAIHAVSL